MKIQFHWHVINDLYGEEINGSFYEKELQKTNQKEFRIEKNLKENVRNCMLTGKKYDNSFNSGT